MTWLAASPLRRGLIAPRLAVRGLSGGGYMMTGRSRTRRPKVLVTGAVGQIGQELVPHLRQIYGAENVLASDVRSPPPDLFEAGPFHYINVLETTQLSRLVVEEGIDTIVHLVAILSATGEKDPQLALAINNGGTQNVLELARQHGLKVFCPSTIAAFGPTSPKENTPEDCIMRPTTMYGVTKIHTELLGEYYHANYGIDFRCLRYPGVISANAMPGGGTTDYAVDIFHEALDHQRYTCFLDEGTRLPMIYMPDLLKATSMFMMADNKRLSRRVYNLGSMSFSPDELMKSIQRRMPNFAMDYLAADFRQDIADTWPNKVDDSQATEDWGWQADYDLDRMVDHMLDTLQAKKQAEGDGDRAGGALPKTA